MTPLLLQLHFLGLSFGLSVFGLYLGLAAGVGAVVFALCARRGGWTVHDGLVLAFWGTTSGILAARLGGLVVGGDTHGLPMAVNAAVGIAAAAAAVAATARLRGLDPGRAVDFLGCGLAAAHVLVALGCLAAGCCYGRIAPAGAWPVWRFAEPSVAWHDLAATGTMPLAARLTPPLWAVQPIEAVVLALVTFGLVIYARRPRDGRVLGVYLVAAAAVWLVLAPWRAGGWHGLGSVTCLAAGGIALTLGSYAHRLLAPRRDRTRPDARHVARRV